MVWFYKIWPGEGGWFVIFRLFKSIFFFGQLNFIVLFPFLIKYYHILFIVIVFWLGCDRMSGLLFFVPALLLSTLAPLFLSSSSVSLSYFILAVPMRECLGKHSCMSSTFPLAILNGTFFCSVKAMNNWKLSAILHILIYLVKKVACVMVTNYIFDTKIKKEFVLVCECFLWNAPTL